MSHLFSSTYRSTLSSFVLAATAIALVACMAIPAWGNERDDIAFNDEDLKSAAEELHTASSTGTLTDGWSQCGSCEWQLSNNGTLTIRPLGNASTGKLANWSSTPPWYDFAYRIKRVVICGSIDAPTLESFFSGCWYLTSIEGLSSIKMSSTSSMAAMFQGCKSLTKIDLTTSNWHSCDTVTDMRAMFQDCAALESLDMYNVSTSAVTNMNFMFSGCSSLKSLRFTCCSITNVTTMAHMFSGCSSLVSLNLSGHAWRKAPLLYGMFKGCTSLQSLNLSGWGWDSGTPGNIQDFFNDCESLTKVKFGSNWPRNSGISLPTPRGETSEGRYTGNWVSNDSKETGPFLGSYFASSYSSYSMCGTWVAEFKKSAISLSGATISIAPQEYSGSSITPKPTVQIGSTQLRENIDYTLSYKNNVNAGSANVIINGIGDYEGVREISFAINPKVLPAPAVSSSNIVFDGKAKEPVIVKDGNRLLELNKDYTVSYSRNINVGTARAVVTGKGNYKGSKVVNFEIKEPVASNTGGTKPNASSGATASNSSSGVVKGNASNSGSSQSGYGSNGSLKGNQLTALTPNSSSQSGISNPVSKNPIYAAQMPSKAPSVTGTWKKSKGKWWFSYDSKSKTAQKKSYPANEWVTIKGKRYHFDSKGYMSSKWYKSGSSWYWLGTDGAMKTGWQKVSGKWYFMERNGIMQTGKRKISNQTYYLASSGAMKTGWNKESNKWYYYKSSGAMAKGWAKVKNKWYYLNPSDGVMKTGFYDVNKVRYYSNSSGAMQTGWKKLSNKWYYFNKSGAMQKNKWISGNYWVGSDGVMATNSWVDGGRYYVGSSGKWIKNASITSSSQQTVASQWEDEYEKKLAQQEAQRKAAERYEEQRRKQMALWASMQGIYRR